MITSLAMMETIYILRRIFERKTDKAVSVSRKKIFQMVVKIFTLFL